MDTGDEAEEGAGRGPGGRGGPGRRGHRGGCRQHERFILWEIRPISREKY